MNNLFKKLILSLILSFVLLLGLSCGDHKNLTASPPLFLGVAYDGSGSADEHGLPVLTSSHLDQMISILQKRGGTVAFGLIDSKAFEPLLRLELVPVNGRLDERAKRNIKNQEAISQFKAEVEGIIKHPRNAKRTDINGAIARFALLFGEPTIRGDEEKVMIFISDGIDTGPWKKLSIRLPQDVKIFTVGVEPSLAKKLFGDRVVLFEAIEPALESLDISLTMEKTKEDK